MLPLSDFDRFCTATLAGAFGIHVIQPDAFTMIEVRLLRAGVTNSTGTIAAPSQLRAGNEQGKD